MNIELKEILNSYIFKYTYPKVKRQKEFSIFLKIDTSKIVKVGGYSENGYELQMLDGNKYGAVITTIDALKAIKENIILVSLTESYNINIKAIKKSEI